MEWLLNNPLKGSNRDTHIIGLRWKVIFKTLVKNRYAYLMGTVLTSLFNHYFSSIVKRSK